MPQTSEEKNAVKRATYKNMYKKKSPSSFAGEYC